MSSEIDSVFVTFPSDSAEDRAAREAYFVGDILEWAGERAKRFGDVVVAKHMIIDWIDGDKHSTAWVERYGTDQETGERYQIHHVACDCLRAKGELGSDVEVVEFCPMAHVALTERARMIDREYRIFETLRSVVELEMPEGEKQSVYQDLVLTAMEETLIEDRRYPERWMANVISGEHHADLMGEILHIHPTSVQMYAEILELQGKVEINESVLKLKEAA